MNIDIDEDDCIVVETNGSEVGKRRAGAGGVQGPCCGLLSGRESRRVSRVQQRPGRAVSGKCDAFPG